MYLVWLIAHLKLLTKQSSCIVHSTNNIQTGDKYNYFNKHEHFHGSHGLTIDRELVTLIQSLISSRNLTRKSHHLKCMQDLC